MGKAMELVGQRFGRLTVIAIIAVRRRGVHKRLQVRCDCGTTATPRLAHVLDGRTTSCGCFNREAAAVRATRHGLTHSRVHTCWNNMLQRCANPRQQAYARYGARGITVCAGWASFDVFLADMGMPPSATHEIDRIDNGRGYEPGNCRWVTRVENSRNKDSNRRIVFQGRDLCLVEWAASTGIPYGTLHQRLRRGWPVADALTRRVDVR